MADETVITHLGPYEVADVTDDILGSVVCNQNVPIVVKQVVDGRTVFAVLARNKDFKIVCAGCFKRDMRLADCTRCKTCSSFVKHHETRKGVRQKACKEDTIADVAAACKRVTLETTAAGALGLVKDQELLAEVKRRDLENNVAMALDDEDLIDVVKSRGVPPVWVRPNGLIHELRRQKRKADQDSYYLDEKKEGLPHWSDKVGADIKEKGCLGTRNSKKTKVDVIHCKPMTGREYSV